MVPLLSYGGVHQSEAELRRPRSVDALREAFAQISTEGRKVTLRGSSALAASPSIPLRRP
jgi:hypothetical protein